MHKQQGNIQGFLSASKTSPDKFISLVHRASGIILVVIVSLKRRTSWIPKAKGKYQLEVDGIRVAWLCGDVKRGWVQTRTFLLDREFLVYTVLH